MNFDPDWVIAPGETLKEWREENHLGLRSAATTCVLPVETYERIEQGKQRITTRIAAHLHSGTGIPAYLWLNLERTYRAGLKAGKTDTTAR